MSDEKIRLKFAEEDMQDLYVNNKVSLSKLVEFTFVLGTLATTFVRKDSVPQEHLTSAYETARHLLITVLQVLPESASDNDIEEYILSGSVLNHLIYEKAFPMMDNLTFSVIKAAQEGKAEATTVSGGVVDLIFSEDEEEQQAPQRPTNNELLDLVDNMPVKKLDA